MKNQINDRIAGLKERLGSPHARPVLIACCILPCLIFIIFGYKPLIAELQDASKRLQVAEAELNKQLSAIASMEKIDVKGKIMKQNEIPLAIDELTEKGRELGLRFCSISPRQLEETTQPGIWKLPINFEIESEYQNLGQFLDYIDKSPRNIAMTESLSINPKEEDLSRLSVEIVINLYVERKHEEKQ